MLHKLYWFFGIWAFIKFSFFLSSSVWAFWVALVLEIAWFFVFGGGPVCYAVISIARSWFDSYVLRAIFIKFPRFRIAFWDIVKVLRKLNLIRERWATVVDGVLIVILVWLGFLSIMDEFYTIAYLDIIGRYCTNIVIAVWIVYTWWRISVFFPRHLDLVIQIYFILLWCVASLGFYQLLYVIDMPIPVPHFMDIGPNEPLYPFGGKYGEIAPNAHLYDLFHYAAQEEFVGVDSWKFSNWSRALYYEHGYTDHSPYKESLLNGKLSIDKAIAGLGLNLIDMGLGWPEGLTKKQAVYYWIFATDLYQTLAWDKVTGLQWYGVNFKYIGLTVDSFLHNPLKYDNFNLDAFIEFSERENYFRYKLGLPPLPVNALHQLGAIHMMLHTDILHIMRDPILTTAFGFSMLEPKSDYLYPLLLNLI